MSDKIYAVLCAPCAERMSEFYNLHEFTSDEPRYRQCRTCLNRGFYSEYALTKKDFDRSRKRHWRPLPAPPKGEEDGI